LCGVGSTRKQEEQEYANTAWSPYKQYLIEEVEKVQKRATKLVHGCKHLPYTERLKYLKLPALNYRRHRGDKS